MSEEAKKRWLTFRLLDQSFAVNVQTVREILPEQGLRISRLPQMPPAAQGVVRIRNEVVSVADLRCLLGMKSLRTETREIIDMFQQHENDHVAWLADLEASVLEGREPDVQLDPNLCAFGRWYKDLNSNKQKLNDFARGDLALLGVIDRFDEPHRQIHQVGERVANLVGKGMDVEAIELIKQCQNTELKTLIELFTQCRQLFSTLRTGVLIVCIYQSRTLGLLVDAIEEVLTIRPEEVKQIPNIGEYNSYLRGVVQTAKKNTLLQVLSVESIMSGVEHQEPVLV